MIQEYIQSLFLIFMAEMGDKTQILAMAFATQYTVGRVLLGVFIGSLLNHGIAVALGSYLSNLIPIQAIQIIAGISFVGFALWTLKNDEEDDGEEESKKNLFGPVATVAIAFFIGELGDKTQLTAITLSVGAKHPFFVLLGTVSGMILTSGLGIFVGSKIGDKIPEFTIRIGSAGIFLFFGIAKLYGNLPKNYINLFTVVLFFLGIGAACYVLLKPSLEARRRGKRTPLQEVALTLYEHTQRIKEGVEEICLGTGHCGQCKGKQCIIGYTKTLIDQLQQQGAPILEKDWNRFAESLHKEFDQGKVVESLSMTLIALGEESQGYNQYQILHQIRRGLELILLKEQLVFEGDLQGYLKQLSEKDPCIAEQVKDRLNALKG